MPTPKAGYTLNGEKIPSVTQIISRFKDSGGLLHWAFKQGKDGKDKLYDESQKAADIGTCAHGMVELYNKGQVEAISDYAARTLYDLPQRELAFTAFESYLSWAQNFNVTILEQEVGLVSQKHKYGGTLDAVGLISNSLCLLDWKTSNSIYTDYLIQVAAYGELWNENFPERQITGGFHILRFSKDHGDFAHHYFANLDDGWRQFLLFREAFDIDKVLKKRAA